MHAEEKIKPQAIIPQVLKYAQTKIPAAHAEIVNHFIKIFYQNVSYEDIEQRSIQALFEAAYHQWLFIQHRRTNEIKIHLFNPPTIENRRDSNFTIVQVCEEDMPFIVDSMRMEINRLGYVTHLTINLGSIILKRNAQHEITEILPLHSKAKGAVAEAVIYMEIDRILDAEKMQEIRENLLRVLTDVRASVEDWQPMQNKIKQAINEIQTQKLPMQKEVIRESIAFLQWLANDHFTFLGYRDYVTAKENNEPVLKIVKNSGLGVLRDDSHSRTTRNLEDLPPEAKKRAKSKNQLLIINKTNSKATVHRPDTYTDYIGVKKFNHEGEIVGEHRFVGLYTSDAYNSNPKNIPLLRTKVKNILKNSNRSPNGHDAKTLLNIINTLPRDDLFQASQKDLLNLSMSILHAQQRQRTRIFILKDPYQRYFSCLVYMARARFNTDLTDKIKKFLMQALNGIEVKYTMFFPEPTNLVRIHFVIRANRSKQAHYNINHLESEIAKLAHSWQDDLSSSLFQHFAEDKSSEYFELFANAFPASYKDIFNSEIAVDDIKNIMQNEVLKLSVYRKIDSSEDNTIHLKLYQPNHTMNLSDAIPILENMGFFVIGEEPFKITLSNKKIYWINDFNLVFPGKSRLNLEDMGENFQTAFIKTWQGDNENDAFNKLLIRAELNWREVAILRTYSRYLRQIKFTFSQTYIADTLYKHADITKLLIKLFHEKFDPNLNFKTHTNNHRISKIIEKIHEALDHVESLDEDKIFKHFLEVINATIRSNFYQKDANGLAKSYISIKLNPKKIENIPLPKPEFEIYVYSPEVEGIHLRNSSVARGGLRWSDRREDFRTEVLGLMKAQTVKNAVIVPSGAKGGFVVKKSLPFGSSREEILSQGIHCYKIFISGLLDITDNIINNKVIPPQNVVRYDTDDPYLVVAADKGTATFSDIANAIAKNYNFWLGDAFASGGSAGYDHKKMGITARGAWESVKRHFQELDLNVENEDFTVVGIGDMSGDVFGNGMLLSKHMRLIAAFNHMHIFIDPNPDAATSYLERNRLFNLPRSTWEDYDRNLISNGGGIFSRNAKFIKLSPEVKECLAINIDTIEPNQLIQAILSAPVDLLWNGGIGTYVKASTENNADVGDRNNDILRINANELRCRVVAEGGNLGFTQLARVEYNLNDGKINTDFIDNSAGVDCSDHEVNIKILLNNLVHSQELTEKERNKLLANMTDSVAHLVLENNYRQTRVISQAKFESYHLINLYMRMLDKFEQLGKINRELECLPDEKTLISRKANNLGLARSELATLLAYAKIILKQEILASDILDDAQLLVFLEKAFPQTLVKKYYKEMTHHQLKNDIIATQLANSLVTDMGITFVYQMHDETGRSTNDIVKAYVIAQTIFDMPNYWAQINSLDNLIPIEVQRNMALEVIRLIRRVTRWLLSDANQALNIQKTINHFAKDINYFFHNLPKFLVGSEKAQFESIVKEYTEAKVPEKIAVAFASSRPMFAALNIIEAANRSDEHINRAGAIYFVLSDQLHLGQFRELINNYPVQDHWSVLARAACKGDLDTVQKKLATGVLEMKLENRSIKKQVNTWLKLHDRQILHWNNVLTELLGRNTIDFAMLSVALRTLDDLANASMQSKQLLAHHKELLTEQ